MKPIIFRLILVVLLLVGSFHGVSGEEKNLQSTDDDWRAFLKHYLAIQKIDPEKVDREHRLRREEGLRWLIEVDAAKPDKAIKSLDHKLAKLLPEATQKDRPTYNVDLQFLKLIQNKDYYDRFAKYDLEKFAEIRIHNYAYEDLESIAVNIFDLTYYMREQFNLDAIVKIEPDIPFAGTCPAGGFSFACNNSDLRTLDRAWHLRNADPTVSPGSMNVEAAWGFSSGEGSRIAHLDTGFNTHEDLEIGQENIDQFSAYNALNNNSNYIDPLNYNWWGLFPGHGISTGSVMISKGTIETHTDINIEGGTGGPGIVTGVAPQATLIPIRCMRTPIRLFMGSVVRAIDYAVALDSPNECHIISMSLGGWNVPNSLRTAIDVAVEQNIIVLAAAGNYIPWVVSPASIQRCIAIAATNVNAMPWNNSARGNAVDFSAPGESVWRALRNEITDPENEAAPACGTSLSTAGVAGVAALWIAHYGQDKLNDWLPTGWYWQDLFRNHVAQTARQPVVWDDDRYGAGIVDVGKLLTIPFETPSSSQNRHNLYFPATTVSSQLPLLFNHSKFNKWLSDARMLIARSKESEQSTNTNVNTKSVSLNYLDVLIDIYGRKREKKTTILLSNLMQLGLHRKEELVPTWLKDEMDIWGAELTYLNYSHPEFYHMFLAMIDYENIPIKNKIYILLNQLNKISSKTLASRLETGKN